jgi:hypothetical protein
LIVRPLSVTLVPFRLVVASIEPGATNVEGIETVGVVPPLDVIWFAVPATLTTHVGHARFGVVPPDEVTGELAVTLVTRFENAVGALNDGGAGAPLGFPKMVPAGAFERTKVGVVVGFVTVKSGDNPLTLVTVPFPPFNTNQVQGGNPVCKQM